MFSKECGHALRIVIVRHVVAHRCHPFQLQNLHNNAVNEQRKVGIVAPEESEDDDRPPTCTWGRRDSV
jgi:hypothetical protein